MSKNSQGSLPATDPLAPSHRDIPAREYKALVHAQFDRMSVPGDGNCLFSAFLSSLGIISKSPPKFAPTSLGAQLRLELASRYEDLRGLNPQGAFQEELRALGPTLASDEYGSFEHLFFLARIFQTSVTINSVVSKTSTVQSVHLNLLRSKNRVFLECALLQSHYFGLKPKDIPLLLYPLAADGGPSALLDVITSWLLHRTSFPPRAQPYSLADLAAFPPVPFNAQLPPAFAELSMPSDMLIKADTFETTAATSSIDFTAEPPATMPSSATTRLVPVYDAAGNICT